MDVVLGDEGIRQLTAQMRRVERDIRKIVTEIEKLMAQVAEQILISKAPTHDVDGNIPGEVSIEKRQDGYAVCYSGQDVAYIEFGTGIRGKSQPYPDGEALALVSWQYDEHGHGTKGWFYYSKRDGTLKYSRGGAVPEKPVFDTMIEMRYRMEAIIERQLREKLT